MILASIICHILNERIQIIFTDFMKQNKLYINNLLQYKVRR